MYNHAPADYVCPMCAFVSGNPEPGWSIHEDIVLEDDQVLALISSRWWPRNLGHVILVPKQHFENIFDLPDELGTPIHAAAKRIALALKATYNCNGVSTRQHNEPAGNQDLWHYHLHIFPRYTGDELYLTPRSEIRETTPEERRPYAERLRNFLKQQ
jgi:histidine triad (HIT) family protein